MPDIENADDVKLLIDTFYGKVRQDEVIGFIFNDIAQVDWPNHLPKMYAFWEFLLLDHDTYTGNPIEPHRKLNEKIQLTATHFERWLLLFHQSVDELFQGKRAEDAKNRSKLIAMTWQPKFS